MADDTLEGGSGDDTTGGGNPSDDTLPGNNNDTGGYKGPVRGPRQMCTIEMQRLLGVETPSGDEDKSILSWSVETQPILVYWKRGIIDWLGDAATAYNVLNYDKYKMVWSAVAEKNDDGDFEVKTFSYPSQRPRGSFRQVSIGVQLKETVQLKEYDKNGLIGTRHVDTIKLAYDRRYKIKVKEWIKWLYTHKADDVYALITPDGDKVTIPDAGEDSPP